ncbi:PEP-utilizing enzyme [Candidatus Saccharibacteria bacterium]|nr:PEP-utilizing enzyme [Candidatus Saccharibacteria bacterium]MCL1963379.1 PEP-utilizing enzyme [Candidatus Saccharibacteria bacterium]
MLAVVKLCKADNVKRFGGKAVNLGAMLRNGLPVPDGLAVGLAAFNDQGKLFNSAKVDIYKLLQHGKLYAVRSSATVEDADTASWAGQFESFLNVPTNEITDRVEQCHNSAKLRVQSYAEQNGITDIDIAVVVQEMVKPTHAGVLFTTDPISGVDEFVTEYIEGLGEELVSGRADPKRISWNAGGGDHVEAPFDIVKLTKLAQDVEKVFGAHQDIEWAFDGNVMWLVQARPITTKSARIRETYLGDPDELFYWGPSRANLLYMGDFMTGLEQFFVQCVESDDLPNPPKMLTLFHDGKVVFLINAKSYSDFTTKLFNMYADQNRREHDRDAWRVIADELLKSTGEEFNKNIIKAWTMTEFAEFALYGAEKAIAAKLERFDERTRAKLWGVFSTPDKPTFLNLLDQELAESRDTKKMAQKYSWVRDGYAGPNDEAEWYFVERLKAIDENGLITFEDQTVKRTQLTAEYGLSEKEVAMLDLARHLAEFMDERKEWMMRTRRSINKPLSNIQCSWFFDGKQVVLIGEEDTKMSWERYIDFRSADDTISGVVANTGGRHFISGEVAVLNAHTDPVADDRILVVPSTSPGWIPLMRRARAMITDHGGMMSHAAIVAREFGLPCIVGTKTATKLLKTGDKVVMDLIKGEVSY